jgi:hypothetical protein
MPPSASPGVVTATRFIRRMSGGAQAHLFGCDDGHCRVVKFTNNPQGRRTVVNDFVACQLMRAFNVSTPEVALVRIDDRIRSHPAVGIRQGRELIQPAGELHFGSKYPGDPETTAVFDFFPETMLHRVSNLVEQFSAALVMDTWLSNVDGRQTIFFRADAAKGISSQPSTWSVQMIDNGFAFHGREWAFRDAPLSGLYPRISVYGRPLSMWQFSPWLVRIMDSGAETLQTIAETVPREWISGEERAFQTLIRRCDQRRERVGELVSKAFRCIRARTRERIEDQFALRRLARSRPMGLLR